MVKKTVFFTRGLVVAGLISHAVVGIRIRIIFIPFLSRKLTLTMWLLKQLWHRLRWRYFKFRNSIEYIFIYIYNCALGSTYVLYVLYIHYLIHHDYICIKLFFFNFMIYVYTFSWLCEWTIIYVPLPIYVYHFYIFREIYV